MECVAWDEILAAAVEVVTEQGMAEVGEVDADLVRAPRLKLQTQKCMTAVCPLCFVMGTCRLSIGGNAAQNDAW